RKRDRCTAHFLKCPTWMNPHVHVHPPRSARLRPALKTYLFQKSLHFKGYRAHVVPWHTRTWIQIYPQFVRVIKIRGTDCVWMEFDTPKIHTPGEAGHVVYHNFFRQST